MNRTLHVDPRDSSPIWRQIEEGVRRLVASGALQPGGLVPSVRDLASELRVNPATVAKAYQRLTEAEVLTVRRGEGTFVSQSPPPFEGREKSRSLHEGALRYASLATTLGATSEETVSELKGVLQSFKKNRIGGAS
ncbi:MAG: GntR family transcriptional regulator [Thermoanaerobaculia bacterium]